MSIKLRLQEDMKNAMRNKEKSKLTLIRMVNSDIKNAEISKRGELEDTEVVSVIQKFVKQNIESLEAFAKVGNEEKVAELQSWNEILTEYLPKQLTEEEVKVIVMEVVQEQGFTSKKEMGKAMAAIMPKVKGKVDGKVVNKVVSQVLS